MAIEPCRDPDCKSEYAGEHTWHWQRARTRADWPETWDRQVGDAWYTCERAANGLWCTGRSRRRGDSDYGVTRGVYHATLQAAQAWCDADARTWGG